MWRFKSSLLNSINDTKVFEDLGIFLSLISGYSNILATNDNSCIQYSQYRFLFSFFALLKASSSYGNQSPQDCERVEGDMVISQRLIYWIYC